jgi:hypothetical protein
MEIEVRSYAEMHVVTANTGDWIVGTSTEIRVEFDDEATSEAAR